jgi:hypothetical protein
MRVLIVAFVFAAAPALSVAQVAPPAANDPAIAKPNGLGLEQAPGLGALNKPKGQIRIEENSVLPDAGAAGPSAAPTMALDCQRNPQECSDPVISTGSVPPPNQLQQSK